MQMRGLSAVVTGGASGLGAAAAQMLARNGVKVAIFDMNAELGAKVASQIDGHFIDVDVTDGAAVAAALDEAEARHGGARILVNCAGIAPPAKTVDREGEPHSLEVFAKVIQVNLVGAFNVVAKFAARAAKLDPVGEERGVIINTASIAAFDGQIGQAAYAASKSGVVGMTLPIARDLAGFGIRVMTIAPGLLLTPMMMQLPQAAQDALGKMTPFPSRLGKPEEYALLVESIINNPMLNGETIRLDGAVRLPPR